MRPVVRLLGASLFVSVLALAAGIGTAKAQTPPPPPPAVPWNEAELAWTPPTDYAGPVGGSLASCAAGPCGVMYIVEAAVSGGSGWGPVAITAETHYRATNLRPGVWQFRVRAYFPSSGYGTPGPTATKTVAEPGVSAPPTTTVK